MKLEDVSIGAREAKESHPDCGLDVEDFASTAADKNPPRSNETIDLESAECPEDNVLGGEIISEEIFFYRDFGEENLYAFDKNRENVGMDSESVERTEEVVVSEGSNMESVAENSGAGAWGTDEKGNNEDVMQQLLRHVQELTRKQEAQAQEIDELKKRLPLEMDEDEKYSQSSYTWIRLHSKPSFVFFGLIIFIIQFLFIGLMMYGAITSEDMGLGLLKHGEEGIFLWIAQGLAMVTFMIFPESCVMDVVQALRYFPRGCCCRCSWATFACGLKLLQGLFAVIATLYLIFGAASPLDVLLNFAAVSYVSGLDEHAFELAKMGLFGPSLRDESERIAGEKEPVHKLSEDMKAVIQARPISRFYLYALVPVVFFFSSSSSFIVFAKLKIYSNV